jgi:hypothetical protein
MSSTNSISRLDSLQAELKLATQRAALSRDILIGVSVAVTGIMVYLLLYRNTAMRDLADLRNEAFKIRAETGQVARTAEGVGKSFDQYRDDQVRKGAELEGQLLIVRRIVTWAGGILTTLIIAALLYWLRLS